MIQNTKSSVSFPPIFQIFLLFFVQKHHWNNFLLYSYPFNYTGNGKTRGEAMIGVIASPNINPGKLALLATSTHNCYYVAFLFAYTTSPRRSILRRCSCPVVMI